MKKIALLAACAALMATPAFADLAGELSTAQTHAGMASTQTDIAMVHKHLQHAVNCLVGPSGAGFDEAAGNPCGKAGPGAIPDSTDAAVKAKLTTIAASIPHPRLDRAIADIHLGKLWDSFAPRNATKPEALGPPDPEALSQRSWNAAPHQRGRAAKATQRR